jgi:GNAT superfamily N-acetyltransferase
VPRLADARSDHIDAILRESYALWGAGLGYDAYRAFWNDISDTPWAKRHLRYCVWLDDDGSLLSSLKLYRPRMRLLGTVGGVAGIGAVFTPQSRRCCGHASALIRAVLDEARSRGDIAALLFSDVGARFYSGLGFRELPAEEAWGEILRASGPRRTSEWRLRPMGEANLGDVMRSQEAACGTRPLAILRDRDYWGYLVERSRRFFERLDGSDLSTRFQVALQGDRFAGYIATVDSGDVWIVREVEAEDGEPESSAAIVRLGLAQARSRGRRRCYAWLPRETCEAIPEWSIRIRPRRRAIPMLQRLDGGGPPTELDSPEAAFIPYLDQF